MTVIEASFSTWATWIVLALLGLCFYVEFRELLSDYKDWPKRPVTGREALAGRQVEVLSGGTDAAGRYQVRLDEEIWFARPADGDSLQAGSHASVVGIEGLVLVVVPDTDA